MLEVTQFDTVSYQEIFEKMRNEVMKRSANTFYDSDMEIVLLEMWALLLDMQNYTMDVTSERMEKEMYHFLLGDLHSCSCAEGVLYVRHTSSKWMYAHTLFEQISNIPFEVSENTYIQDNDIIKYEYYKKGQAISCKGDMLLEKGMQIELTLRAPMEVDRPCVFYFEINNNRVTPSKAYPQALISCSYESNHGMCELAFVDETQGFLTSGRLLVFPHKYHHEASVHAGWNVRIDIVDAWYDQAPSLHDVLLNPLNIAQQKTYASSKIYPMQRTLYIQDAIAFEGTIQAFVYQNEGYQAISITLEKGEEGIYVHIPIDCVGEHILLILQRSDLELVGSTNGRSMQRIPIPYQDIEYMSLMMKQGDAWHEVTVFDIDTYQKEQLYGVWYHAQEHWLQFGCGKDFLIPCKGHDNIIYRDLILTKGKKGNIKEQVLTSHAFEQRYPTLKGKDKETIQEAKNRVSTLVSQSSSLRATDIQKVVQQFPGNALTYVKCVPKKYVSFNHNDKGYVIMLGSTNELSSTYLTMLKQWLITQLPLGIKIELRQAEELKISVYLKATFTPNALDEVHQCIETWMTQRNIGESVRSVDIIQYILQHTSIKEIRECHFYKNKQQVDHFQIPYHTYVVLENIEIVASS